MFAGASPKNSGEGGIGKCYQGLGSHPRYDKDQMEFKSQLEHFVDVPVMETLASHLLKETRLTATWQGSHKD